MRICYWKRKVGLVDRESIGPIAHYPHPIASVYVPVSSEGLATTKNNDREEGHYADKSPLHACGGHPLSPPIQPNTGILRTLCDHMVPLRTKPLEELQNYLRMTATLQLGGRFTRRGRDRTAASKKIRYPVDSNPLRHSPRYADCRVPLVRTAGQAL
ncbi:hypothetical protein J6590_032635 [Homalodisca vitripennis]|nr:hypothetical protein J6590_032635 [Homalodisca vitripennis]